MPSLEIGDQLSEFLFRGVFEKLGVFELVVYALELLIYRLAFLDLVQIVFEHCRELLPKSLGRPAQMGLEHLPHVHTGRNAKRIQNDVHRGPVRKVGHVLDGKNPGDDALVSVPSGHLVSHLEFSFDGDIDLHHLDDARRKLIASFQLVYLFLEKVLYGLHLLAVIRR